MSWREMRNFSEIMRALGYPRIISIENFRTPNFMLLAEVLKWLALRFDSNADVPQCLDTEQDRVLFIKMIVHFMATKAFIKLNPKRLYKADGYAVKEVLKLGSVLFSAMKFDSKKEDDDSVELNISEIMNVSRLKQLQQTRSLASQLTTSGAALHSFMAREVQLREVRTQAIERQLDSDWVEECLATARDNLRVEIKQTEQALINIAADEGTLDGKIEKRRNELERNHIRLSTLQSVRPAYMEEYEQLEEELSGYYATYLTRFRNLAYLENLKEEMMKSDEAQFPEDDQVIKSAVEDLRKITEIETGEFDEDEKMRGGREIGNVLAAAIAEANDFTSKNSDPYNHGNNDTPFLRGRANSYAAAANAALTAGNTEPTDTAHYLTRVPENSGQFEDVDDF